MIRTTSKAPNGHYRAGQFHSPKGSEWPDDQFTDAQLQQLRDDPRMTVELAEGEPESPSPSPSPHGGEGSAALAERVAELDEREATIGEREQALAERESQLDRELKEIDRLRQLVNDPDYREALLRAAVARVAKAGNADDLTKDGKPKTEAVEAELPGLEISAGERDRFHEEMQAEA